MTSWGWWRVLKGPRVTLGCGPLTLTLEPCYPFSNPKGSYIWRRTWSLVLVVSQKIREGACALKKLGFWGVNGAFPGPWPPGEVGAGSRSPRTVSLVVTWVFPREFKNNKKNKRMFFGTSFKLRFILFLDNPKFTNGNVCPTLRVWGVPSLLWSSGDGTSGNVDPNSWWWWWGWVLVSDAGADVVLYLVEPVFLQLQVVHHILEMRVGAGMIVWGLFKSSQVKSIFI